MIAVAGSSMSKELFEQISAIANSDFEENKAKFSSLFPKEIFMFSYIHGFRDAFTSYTGEDDSNMSEVCIGDIVTEVPAGIINTSFSGAEKEYNKYEDKIKAMQSKEIYTLGFQSGFQNGYEVYYNKNEDNRDAHKPIKYYHANFDRLH